jgi:hypothetical protein
MQSLQSSIAQRIMDQMNESHQSDTHSMEEGIHKGRKRMRRDP